MMVRTWRDSADANRIKGLHLQSEDFREDKLLAAVVAAVRDGGTIRVHDCDGRVCGEASYGCS